MNITICMNRFFIYENWTRLIKGIINCKWTVEIVS